MPTEPPPFRQIFLAIALPPLLILLPAVAFAWQIDRLAGAIRPEDRSTLMVAVPGDRPALHSGLALGAVLGLLAAACCWRPLRALRRAHASALGDLEAQAERREREQLAWASESLRSHVIFMLDPRGRVASWDRNAERLLGYRADDVLARNITFLYDEDQVRNGLPQHDLMEAAGAGRCEDTRWMCRKDGFRFEASTVLVAIRDISGGLCGFTQVIHEVA